MVNALHSNLPVLSTSSSVKNDGCESLSNRVEGLALDALACKPFGKEENRLTANIKHMTGEKDRLSTFLEDKLVDDQKPIESRKIAITADHKSALRKFLIGGAFAAALVLFSLFLPAHTTLIFCFFLTATIFVLLAARNIAQGENSHRETIGAVDRFKEVNAQLKRLEEQLKQLQIARLELESWN